MDDANIEIKGKQRYAAGVLKYAQMGYYVPRLRAQGHRHHRPVPHYAAGRGRSD